MSRISLFAVFHLNLMFSSIEEEQRIDVVKRCYWPLLNIAKKNGFPIGIEATGYTLSTISHLDPEWLAELRTLLEAGTCEFVGSGYTQIIGPLVPARVNAANLRIGNHVYKGLLGLQPRIALVSEQAFSSGLIQHYLDAGYGAIVMEWDNPARYHRQWEPQWRYYPQIAVDQHGSEIALIWNKSIAFQKFQRYAHREMDLDEYLIYLASHLSTDHRVMSLYGNDAEIFDFRPGRFHTETPVEHGEWDRIGVLLDRITNDDRFQMILPGRALEMLELQGAGRRLSLETPQQPVPVKKQEKYNLTRWAVTGRDDTTVNTRCWRIFNRLKDGVENDWDWKELCYLWSSDFRTHITEKRWKAYLERLHAMEERLGIEHKSRGLGKRRPATPTQERRKKEEWHWEGNYLVVDVKDTLLKLDCRRGMAIRELYFKDYWSRSLVGTLPHGYFDDIGWGADFYSGHIVLESPGRPKVTDLNPVGPVVERLDDSVVIRGSVTTDLGPVHKELVVFEGSARVELRYRLDWKILPSGSLRLGHVTINPEAFIRKSLYFGTHNGGLELERFDLLQEDVDHGLPVSFLVSSSGGIGVTEGLVLLGDDEKHLRIEIDRSLASAIGLVVHHKVGSSYFCRLSFSILEMDDTTRNSTEAERGDPIRFSMSITPGAGDLFSSNGIPQVPDD